MSWLSPLHHFPSHFSSSCLSPLPLKCLLLPFQQNCNSATLGNSMQRFITPHLTTTCHAKIAFVVLFSQCINWRGGLWLSQHLNTYSRLATYACEAAARSMSAGSQALRLWSSNVSGHLYTEAALLKATRSFLCIFKLCLRLHEQPKALQYTCQTSSPGCKFVMI